MRHAIVILLVFVGIARGDSPATRTTYVKASKYGRYIFVMFKPEWNDKNEMVSKGRGVARKLREDGTFEDLWTVSGWHSHGVRISDNGRSLIRSGDWAEGHKPSAEDLAVAFYLDGKLIRKYSTADLVKDHSKVRATVSHYGWEAFDSEFPVLSFDEYSLKTSDGWIYTFSTITGKILFTERQAGYEERRKPIVRKVKLPKE